MGTETRQEPPVTFNIYRTPNANHDEKQVLAQLANAIKLNQEDAPQLDELQKQPWFNPHVALRNHTTTRISDITIENIKRLRQDPLLNQKLLERIIEYMETFPVHFWTEWYGSHPQLRTPCV